jgi:hypothetical protein
MTLLWYPRMEKTGPKSYGRYAWAEESLLPGGTSPLIISNDDDDDLVSVNELFARADPDPAPVFLTSKPRARARWASLDRLLVGLGLALPNGPHLASLGKPLGRARASLLSADHCPAPTAATATPAACTHKRQISEAVRREECPNRPETTPAAPQQQAQGTDTGAGTGTCAGAANNTRKSGRARKPKWYN